MVMSRMLIGGAALNVVVSTNTRALDARTYALSNGWDGSRNIILQISPGVDVAGLIIPASIPNNCLTLVNRGRIGGVINGGKGLQTATRITVDNAGGTIQGSGGMGGVGGQVMIGNGEGYNAAGSRGSGGNGAGFSASSTVTLLAASAGSNGTTAQLGGPTIGGQQPGQSTGGTGGTGGALNQPGGAGGNGYATGAYQTIQTLSYGEAGQPAGPAVDGDSKITWQALGTITGSRIN